MTLDPAARLAALHSSNISEAVALRLHCGETGEGWNPELAIENAIEAFTEEVESALCRGQEELVLSVEVAELVALALKTRKKPSHRPRQSRDQRARRAGIIAHALQLKRELRKSGLRAGDAEWRAATIAAAAGGAHGDFVSPETVRKLMKHRGKKLY